MMQKYTVTDENSQKQELYSKIEHIEADNAALRLKVQGLDRTLADVYAQRDGLQRDLTTLETLAKALNNEKGDIVIDRKDGDKLYAYVSIQTDCYYRLHTARFSSNEDAEAYAALLTHRHGMGG